MVKGKLNNTKKTVEEGIESYAPGGFHPVRLGEVYGNKYKVLRTLGYGRYPTVWLVRNKQDETYWAMKVLSAECYGAEKDIFELEILQQLATTNPNHVGAPYVSRLFDSFEHQGSNGRHVCLIFQVMGESPATFKLWFPSRTLPGPLLQRFTTQLLKALDYAHACDVIHTDIQPSNIMIQVPDHKMVIDYLNDTHTNGPPVQTSDEDYTIIQSQGLRDFYFPEGFNVMTLDLALSDWGVASFTGRHLTESIQPTVLRSPEVILEAPWGIAADIWNLGALLPELLFRQNMFSGRDSAGSISTQTHLEEIVALLGLFPPRLLTQARLKSMPEIFTDDGNIREPSLSATVGLERRFSSLPKDEAFKFEALVRSMLTIDPEERKSARQLLGEPWLQHKFTEDLWFD